MYRQWNYLIFLKSNTHKFCRNKIFQIGMGEEAMNAPREIIEAVEEWSNCHAATFINWQLSEGGNSQLLTASESYSPFNGILIGFGANVKGVNKLLRSNLGMKK